VGGDINKMLNHWPDINAELQTLFREEGKKRDKPIDDLDTVITDFFGIINILMESLLSIRHYLYRSKLTSEEQEKCKLLVKNFGFIWRRDLRLPVPIKLHLLEHHVSEQLDDLGTIGLFLEETMESAHNIDNCMNRVFGNIRSWVLRDKAKLRRGEREILVDVQKAVNNLRSVRKFSDVKEAERANKRAKKDETHAERVELGVASAARRGDELRNM
jgi:hypothetical protein